MSHLTQVPQKMKVVNSLEEDKGEKQKEVKKHALHEESLPAIGEALGNLSLSNEEEDVSGL